MAGKGKKAKRFLITEENIQRTFTHENIQRVREGLAVFGKVGESGPFQNIEKILTLFEGYNQDPGKWEAFIKSPHTTNVVNVLNQALQAYRIRIEPPEETGPAKRGRVARSPKKAKPPVPPTAGKARGTQVAPEKPIKPPEESRAEAPSDAQQRSPGKSTRNPKPLDGDYPNEVKIMRQFVNVAKKGFPIEACEKLLKRLQGMITDRAIGKESPWGQEVMWMQDKLIALCRPEGKILVEKEMLRKLADTFRRNQRTPAYSLLKAFIRLLGTGDREKVRRLYNRYARYNLYDRAFSKELINAKDCMWAFIQGGEARLRTQHDYTLRGLLGLDGEGDVIPSTALHGMQFDTLRLEAPFDGLLGQPSKPFRLLIHGAPGSGKTTLALRLASSLARHNRLRVLIVSIEEGVGYLAKRRVEALGLQSENLYLSAALPKELSAYDVVVVDSITALGKSPAELRELYTSYPALSWVLISQNRKDGRARGSLEFEHDVNTTIRCENLLGTAVKNRFGGRESLRIL